MLHFDDGYFRRVGHFKIAQMGHFKIAQMGHFKIATTIKVRIIYIMLNDFHSSVFYNL
jgi:hypothetical protein